MTEMVNIITKMDEISVPNRRIQREGIIELENIMLAEQQVEITPEHLVHGGMYARAVTVPAGTLLTGHIYKVDHMEIMAKGVLVVTTDDGHSKVLEGFNLMPALTGKKRAAYAIEETTWLTVHSVGDVGHLTPDQIQDMLTAETFDDLDQFYADVNRVDYAHFIASQGWTEEQVRAVVENTDDYTDAINIAECGLSLGDSKIHATGMFAEQSFKAGATLMPARLKGIRTQAGRFINHAVRPNCRFEFDGTDINVVAMTDIAAMDEITVNYRDTMLMRDAGGDLCQE